jgi:hypothetical protein
MPKPRLIFISIDIGRGRDNMPLFGRRCGRMSRIAVDLATAH